MSSVEFVPKDVVEKTVAISLDTSPTVVQAPRPSTTASLSPNLLFSVSTPITSKNPPGVSGNKRQCQGTALSSRLIFDDHRISALPTTEHSSIEEVELAGNVEEPVPTVPTNHVQKSLFMGESDFVKILMEQFEVKIIGSLEAGLRSSVTEKMLKNTPLLPRENNSVVNALIQVVFDQFGPEKPEHKFCDRLAGVLKGKFPATFNTEEAVQSSLGALTLPKSKGQGGYGPLSKRIGNNFYNRLVRPNIKRPAAAAPEEVIKIRKKKVKGYCLRAEKWNIDEKATKEEKDEAFKMYKKLEDAATVQEKKLLVKAASIFIQKQFRTLEPNQVVEDLHSFWEAGPEVLSEWFEEMTAGSKHGSLSVSVTQQLTKVMNIVERFILFKRSDEFEQEMNGVKAEAEERTGNQVFYNIFLLRNLASLFKNKPEKIIFVDGTDAKKDGPDEKTPNIFITKQNTFGESEFDEKVVINLRIGDKLIGKDLSLPEAVAGLIQVFFSFNLLYPQEVDDILQFLERILCSFGTTDGARNKRNCVKKGFRDFEVRRIFIIR